ncbi:MAG: hypothetical protein WCV84_04390 [Patescibacteria group bacterium]
MAKRTPEKQSDAASERPAVQAQIALSPERLKAASAFVVHYMRGDFVIRPELPDLEARARAAFAWRARPFTRIKVVDLADSYAIASGRLYGYGDADPYLHKLNESVQGLLEPGVYSAMVETVVPNDVLDRILCSFPPRQFEEALIASAARFRRLFGTRTPPDHCRPGCFPLNVCESAQGVFLDALFTTAAYAYMGDSEKAFGIQSILTLCWDGNPYMGMSENGEGVFLVASYSSPGTSR